MKHLLQHKLISHHEHGFLSRKSTSTQLLECCADWNVAMNTHNNIDAVYLDFSRAFDSVVHSKLIAKFCEKFHQVDTKNYINYSKTTNTTYCLSMFRLHAGSLHQD